MLLLVYTAITRGYDALRPVPPAAWGEEDFVAFVDEAQSLPPWESRPLERHGLDDVRASRRYKILGSVLFPQYQYSLWLDGKMEWITETPLSNLLELLGDRDLAVFPHDQRTCLYQEACECLHRQLDDPQVIYRQVQRYTREGFPAQQGLVDNAVLLRRHSPAMADFCRLWWQEVSTGSRRDQLSFNYCAWKCGLKYRLLPGFTHANAMLRRHSHHRSRALWRGK